MPKQYYDLLPVDVRKYLIERQYLDQTFGVLWAEMQSFADFTYEIRYTKENRHNIPHCYYINTSTGSLKFNKRKSCEKDIEIAVKALQEKALKLRYYPLLYWSSKRWKTGTVELPLENVLKIHLLDAIEQDNLQLLQWLLNERRDTNTRWNGLYESYPGGYSVMMKAALKNRMQMVDWMQQQRICSVKDLLSTKCITSDGLLAGFGVPAMRCTIIFELVGLGLSKMLKYFLDNGCSIEAKFCSDGYQTAITLESYARACGQMKIAEYLSQRKKMANPPEVITTN